MPDWEGRIAAKREEKGRQLWMGKVGWRVEAQRLAVLWLESGSQEAMLKEGTVCGKQQK